MRLVAPCLAAVLALTGCSRAIEPSASANARPGAAGGVESDPSRLGAPPENDDGGADVIDRSPTAELDRKVLDALRRDRPADLAAVSCRPLPRATFEDARVNVLAGPVTFQRATQTEAGFEIVYRVFHGAHELHLIYEIDETRRPMQLANAWIAGW